jgi:hypothetical protein
MDIEEFKFGEGLKNAKITESLNTVIKEEQALLTMSQEKEETLNGDEINSDEVNKDSPIKVIINQKADSDNART